MSDNAQLLFAILAMDSYHHGVAGGIDLLDRSGIQIDDTIRSTQITADVTIGFSTQIYTLGTTDIIAFRGTDDGALSNPFQSLDFANGYSLAAGNANNPQSDAAIGLWLIDALGELRALAASIKTLLEGLFKEKSVKVVTRAEKDGRFEALAGLTAHAEMFA